MGGEGGEAGGQQGKAFFRKQGRHVAAGQGEPSLHRVGEGVERRRHGGGIGHGIGVPGIGEYQFGIAMRMGDAAFAAVPVNGQHRHRGDLAARPGGGADQRQGKRGMAELSFEQPGFIRYRVGRQPGGRFEASMTDPPPIPRRKSARQASAAGGGLALGQQRVRPDAREYRRLDPSLFQHGKGIVQRARDLGTVAAGDDQAAPSPLFQPLPTPGQAMGPLITCTGM